MPTATLEQAQERAEHFRQGLAQSGVDLQGQRLPLTASLGAGCFDPHLDSDAEAFIKRLDSALHPAKSRGRDRLVLAAVN